MSLEHLHMMVIHCTCEGTYTLDPKAIATRRTRDVACVTSLASRAASEAGILSGGCLSDSAMEHLGKNQKKKMKLWKVRMRESRVSKQEGEREEGGRMEGGIKKGREPTLGQTYF